MGKIFIYLDKEREMKLKELMEDWGITNISEAIKQLIDKAYNQTNTDIEEIVEKIREDLANKNYTEEELKKIGKLISQEYNLKTRIEALKREEKEIGERISELQQELEYFKLQERMRKIVELLEDYFNTFREDLAKQVLDELKKLNAKIDEITIALKMKIQRITRKR